MTDDATCLRIEFRGHVQGVGFRMTTARIARRHPVGGTVRNCSDGSVELIVAGRQAAIDCFLDDLRSAMRGHIRDEQISAGPAGVGTDRFEILL
jgi:acylphosphatase